MFVFQYFIYLVISFYSFVSLDNDGQKLIEALKEYGTTISTVPGMTEISECTERVARAHEIFTEMITDLHDTLRNQVTNAILQSIRELKQCRVMLISIMIDNYLKF